MDEIVGGIRAAARRQIAGVLDDLLLRLSDNPTELIYELEILIENLRVDQPVRVDPAAATKRTTEIERQP